MEIDMDLHMINCHYYQRIHNLVPERDVWTGYINT